jgi:serine/threonine protein phosphatase PrpC
LVTDEAEAATVSICPVCGAAVEPRDQFCEVCGTPLTEEARASEGSAGDAARTMGGASGTEDAFAGAPQTHSTPTAPAGPSGRTEPCVRCGAPPADIDVDGYCTVCGLLQPGPRDHLELDLGWAAGVTDRGRQHPRNEDAFHLELAGPAADFGVVAVVCDGVSSSVRAEDASESAAAAAATVLAAVVGGAGSLADATVHAADAATRAVMALPWTPTDQMASPACTLVSAACRLGQVAVGWVGDSRAYWLGPDPSEGLLKLTVDDSWAEAQIETGRMTEGEAEADPRSHAITRWIGADAPDVDARVITMTPALPGRLLLCSDGLWNYASSTDDMARLLDSQPPDATPIQLARALTTFALTAGGHDNITVVVIDLPIPPAERDTDGNADQQR